MKSLYYRFATLLLTGVSLFLLIRTAYLVRNENQLAAAFLALGSVAVTSSILNFSMDKSASENQTARFVVVFLLFAIDVVAIATAHLVKGS